MQNRFPAVAYDGSLRLSSGCWKGGSSCVYSLQISHSAKRCKPKANKTARAERGQRLQEHPGCPRGFKDVVILGRGGALHGSALGFAVLLLLPAPLWLPSELGLGAARHRAGATAQRGSPHRRGTGRDGFSAGGLSTSSPGPGDRRVPAMLPECHPCAAVPGGREPRRGRS